MSDDVNDRGLSRKHITESVNKSLKRFGMDYVDIFFCHRPDPEVPVDETIRAIEDLINQGKVLYWGTSMWTAKDLDGAYEALKTLNMNRPVVEQPVYNMLDRDFVESTVDGSLEDAVKRYGMGFVVFSPLSEGVLTGKYNNGIPSDSRANDPQASWFKNELLTEDTPEQGARDHGAGAGNGRDDSRTRAGVDAQESAGCQRHHRGDQAFAC